MRNHRIASLIAFVVIGLHSFGSKVPADDARQVAHNFFYERISQYQVKDHDQIRLGPAMTIEYQGIPVYYAFNIQPEGFIFVAAWDEVFPVLAYSFKGSYTESGQPQNFSAWMEQYARQIHHAVTEKVPPEHNTVHSWEYYLNTPHENLSALTGREVEPLITSTWDQGMYYNEMCPADPAGPDGHCYAGCVATAMGQVMNYFRWPDTGTGSYTYNCPPYGTLSVNYDSASYHWDLMETSLNHYNPFIAELLYHLGVSVDMVYGPDGSGMYNHKAAYSLRTYFKYSPETQYVYRDSTTMDWDSLIMAHLDRKIPMYYAGWSVPNIYGHAFVCDGYQDSAYYHFNWGWSGSYDGYFYTDNLTPGGNNFNLAQELVIHAVPDTAAYSYPLYCSGNSEYMTLFGTIEDGSGPLFPYAHLSDCAWLIAPDDTINGISLDFLRYELAAGDTLRVFDGETVSDPLLAEMTAESQPSTVETDGPTLLITFASNESLSGEGFLAEFLSELPVFCSGTTTLTAQADTLGDGSGSYDYQNNTLCKWKIIPEDASEVTLYFLDFETEAGFDLLKVYDYSTLQLLAEYNGAYPSVPPGPVTSPSGKLFITFMTNNSIRGQGWNAYYETDLVRVPDKSPNHATLRIFPNPSAGSFILEIKPEANSYHLVSVRDLSGRCIFQENIEGNWSRIDLNLNHISAGLYFITLTGNDAVGISSKILIQK